MLTSIFGKVNYDDLYNNEIDEEIYVKLEELNSVICEDIYNHNEINNSIFLTALIVQLNQKGVSCGNYFKGICEIENTLKEYLDISIKRAKEALDLKIINEDDLKVVNAAVDLKKYNQNILDYKDFINTAFYDEDYNKEFNYSELIAVISEFLNSLKGIKRIIDYLELDIEEYSKVIDSFKRSIANINAELKEFSKNTVIRFRNNEESIQFNVVLNLLQCTEVLNNICTIDLNIHRYNTTQINSYSILKIFS